MTLRSFCAASWKACRLDNCVSLAVNCTAVTSHGIVFYVDTGHDCALRMIHAVAIDAKQVANARQMHANL